MQNPEILTGPAARHLGGRLSLVPPASSLAGFAHPRCGRNKRQLKSASPFQGHTEPRGVG